MKTRGRHRRAITLVLLALLVGVGLFLLDRIPHVGNRPVLAAGTTFTVTETGDSGCSNPGTRNCTLRQVIIAANANPGTDAIKFNLPLVHGVATIALQSPLPPITEAIFIDGTSQPGYSGSPVIELNGAAAGAGASGLVVDIGQSVIQGLTINRFSGNAIELRQPGHSIIQNNYIGTSTSGLSALPNENGVLITSSTNTVLNNVISGNANNGIILDGSGATNNQIASNVIGLNDTGSAKLGNVVGVTLLGGANGNLVGGAVQSSRNVISGNRGNGIDISGDNSSNNKILGNLIGTDLTATVALGNSGTGVRINRAGGTIIGGESDAERNVIADNGFGGLFISDTTSETRIIRNFIGTNSSGSSLGNHNVGVGLVFSKDTFVDHNIVAFNTGDGISVTGSSTGNAIHANSIFSNGGLGIDLAANGPTPNDPGDADTTQNFPEMISAASAENVLSLRFNRDFVTSNYRLEFYVSNACDPSGHGEGETFILQSDLLNFGGTGAFRILTNSPQITRGRFITATATRLVSPGNTSEFSQCAQVTNPGSFSFASTQFSVNENAGSAMVTIERTSGTEGAVNVRLNTGSGTATADQDYTTTNTVVSFVDGQTSRTVAIPIANDNIAEGNETVGLSLSSPTNDSILGLPNSAVLTINDDDAGSLIHFRNVEYTAVEDCAPAVITVDRLGDTSSVSTIKYNTASGTASNKSDFTPAFGTLTFQPGETEKTFTVLINEDSLSEGPESLNLFLHNPTNAIVGSPSSATLSIVDDASEAPGNVNDNSALFVCQHYHDFLNRQPDAAGQSFWTNEIESCGTNAQCREIKRINVSAAFFLSIEFQQTGFLVYRTHKSAYGNLPGTPVPVQLIDFLTDTQRIGAGVQVGVGDWQARLEANKQSFLADFVQTTKFTTTFPASLTPTQFVETLNTNLGGLLPPAERNQLISDLTTGTKTRAQVLGSVAENSTFAQAESNRAFVLMQYFGYLRRNPNDIPDSNFNGYDFWLNKLNSFNGNFIQAEMVKAFLLADEYRKRFGN